MAIEHNPNYIHHTDEKLSSLIREVIFGAEDGMVSTLGAITGIAAATNDPFTTILAGFVVISVESISMGVGSFVSNKSQMEIDQRKLYEEKIELKKFPQEEKAELYDMYVEDGWPKTMAKKMSETASKNKKLFLIEMAYRELGVSMEAKINPRKNAVAMGISYIVGGSIPIIAYLFFPICNAIVISIFLTLTGLFMLGVLTTKYTKRTWWKAGLEMLTIASVAAIIGFLVGQLVESAWIR